MKKITALVAILIVFHTCLWGHYVENHPMKMTQPDGTVVKFLYTGDEYYGRFHDEDGYTIIQNPETGYYCYAILKGDELIASEYVVGTVSPKSVNLKPNAKLPPEKIIELSENNIFYMTDKFDRLCTYYIDLLSETDKERASDARKKRVFNEIQKMLLYTKSDAIREEFSDMIKIYFRDTIILNMFFDTITYKSSDTIGFKTGYLPSPRTLKYINNIVVYIRFANQEEFPDDQQFYRAMFNSITLNYNSMRNYFGEASYNYFNVQSYFYPFVPAGGSNPHIISYQDSHDREYYCPKSSGNPMGYSNDSIRKIREHTLLFNAINHIKSEVPTNLDLDNNNDSYVDNVCFIAQGDGMGGSTLLWPHTSKLSTQNISINGKRVNNYNFHVENELTNVIGGNTAVLCHEMGHTLGFEDLYHRINDGCTPVGLWDVMGISGNPVQHPCAYTKWKYQKWIPSIPEIKTSGTYTLQLLAISSDFSNHPNCYKIPIKESSQYLVVEYRKRRSNMFDGCLPVGSGLIIYRINEAYSGNLDGLNPGGRSDEVYVFRKNGTFYVEGEYKDAYFSIVAGRPAFNNSTNPYCFTADGSLGNLSIQNIHDNSDGVTLSFNYVRPCDGPNISYSNTSNLPPITNASNSITTSGAVVVKSTDNILFEAGNEVILNSGFEVKLGGVFEINMAPCY